MSSKNHAIFFVACWLFFFPPPLPQASVFFFHATRSIAGRAKQLISKPAAK